MAARELKYKADKVLGISGSLYALSIILEVDVLDFAQ